MGIVLISNLSRSSGFFWCLHQRCCRIWCPSHVLGWQFASPLFNQNLGSQPLGGRLMEDQTLSHCAWWAQCGRQRHTFGRGYYPCQIIQVMVQFFIVWDLVFAPLHSCLSLASLFWIGSGRPTVSSPRPRLTLHSFLVVWTSWVLGIFRRSKCSGNANSSHGWFYMVIVGCSTGFYVMSYGI
jgi:hypothetical protein